MEPGTTSVGVPDRQGVLLDQPNEPIPHAIVNLGDPKANDQIIARKPGDPGAFQNLETL